MLPILNCLGRANVNSLLLLPNCLCLTRNCQFRYRTEVHRVCCGAGRHPHLWAQKDSFLLADTRQRSKEVPQRPFRPTQLRDIPDRLHQAVLKVRTSVGTRQRCEGNHVPNGLRLVRILVLSRLESKAELAEELLDRLKLRAISRQPQ